MRKLVLFDIDGTLVLTGGAGIRAMNRACEELVGHPHALEGIPVAGRTDRIILSDVVTRAGHSLDDGLLERLRDRYIDNLRSEIERPGRTQSFESLGARGGVKAVMPGIRELLEILERRDDVFLGATSAAAHLVMTPRTGTISYRLLSNEHDAADCRTSTRPTFSWSATRRTTSHVRARLARSRLVLRLVGSPPTSCVRAAPTSCSRISLRRSNS
jgi:phosphoglycolate phosphatase-like HAD superfamily hydrolase